MTVVIGLQETVALAAVASLGYVFGRRTRNSDAKPPDVQQQADLERATRIARQLESIAVSLRRELTSHHSRVARFKKRLTSVRVDQDDASWAALCDEAESILNPTLQLASQLSQAYDQIRKQSSALLTFTEGRIDPVTGVCNGKALEEQLQVLLAAMDLGGASFTVALIGIDLSGELDGDSAQRSDRQMLQEVASTIQITMRDNDFVSRYGSDEFVIVMPRTSLAGGSVFAERLRQKVRAELPVTVCCGVTEAATKDTIKALLARADSALYSAKAAGTNRQFLHTGTQIREHLGQRQEIPSMEVEESEPSCAVTG